MTLKPVLLILPALLLAACNNNDDSSDANLPNLAVVATAAPDFSSGALAVAGISAPFTVAPNLDPTTSDLAVRADGDHFFLIKKFGTDQIQRYEARTPTTPTYTYSTNDSGGQDSNPLDIIVANENKAYVIRYGSGKLWIVNPSATTEATFKTGEIDLSQYDADGIPEMSAGLIKNGKLYVAMQRLVNFAATQDGYVAVIDTATDTEIATNTNAAGLKGIALPVRDPVRLVAVPGSDTILVDADGGFDGSFNQQYDGGLISINTNTFNATLLLDDGDDTTHPYGTIDDMTVAANDRAYFIGSAGFGGTQSLYRFNPGATAPVTPVPVANFQNLQLGPISADPSGNLWLGQLNASAPGLTVLGFQSGTETVVAPLIDTVLNPLNIDFVSVPAN